MKYKMSLFVISGETLLPFWGTISNIQTCLGLLIVAGGIFLLQAEYLVPFSAFRTMSFIHFVIYQHDSFDFCSVHAYSDILSC